MTDDFTFDVIKNDIENISNKNKTFEKTYLIVLGLTFAFIFFFAFPYYSLVDVKSILIDITDSINQINSDITKLKSQIQFLNKQSLENPKEISNKSQNLLDTEFPNLTTKLDDIELKIKTLTQKIPIDINNLTKFIQDSEKIRLYANKYTQSKPKILNATELDRLEDLLGNITKYTSKQKQNNEENIQKLINPLENLETPLGKILLNFTYLLLIFPLALAVGFAISLFHLHDILRLRYHFTLLYDYKKEHNKTIKDNKGIDDVPMFLEERMPFLINPHNLVHMIVIWLIPSISYLISIIIGAKILDMEKIHMLPSISVYTSIISFFIGAIILGLGIIVTVIKFRIAHVVRGDRSGTLLSFRASSAESFFSLSFSPFVGVTNGPTCVLRRRRPELQTTERVERLEHLERERSDYIGLTTACFLE